MDIFLRLLDLLFPRLCAGCSAPGHRWCPACASSTGLFRVHRSALDVPVFAVSSYAGPARRLVLAYKERRRRELAQPIGLLLAEAVPRVLARVDGLGRRAPGGRCWLVPAPSRPAATRRRGGNHVTVALKHTAAALRARGLPTEVAPILHLRAGTRDSVGLTAPQRLANLHGRVHLRGPLPPPGHPVLLVDDIVTTGATAAACTTALHTAGVPVTAVLTLAATT